MSDGRAAFTPGSSALCAHCSPFASRPVTPYQVRCACGHEETTWACDIYAPILAAFWCSRCHHADGHHCRMAPAPATTFAATDHG